MNNKQIFRVLGLSLVAALGLAAFTAVGAQAANLAGTRGKFLVLGSTTLNAGVTGSGGLFQILVTGLKIEIHCISFSVTSGFPTNPEKGEALATFLWEKCQVFPINASGELTSKEPLPCIISNGGANHDVTAVSLILVITHEGVLYLLIEPDPPSTFLAEIKYESGKGCPIPLAVEVKKSYAFEVTQAHEKVLAITAGLEALQELLLDELSYGASRAILHGSGTLSLTGAHLGCTWGVV
ncbi:MAG TPA: hypothetical protein VN758_00220 [Solirubrobacterales bacterium]|nr:hypothetical protein [Solirubrobacterales bacterium]